MSPQEFSDSFDTLLNSNAPAGQPSLSLDNYEKSLLLTEAQNQTIVELYTGRNNKGSSFEETEELRSNLRNLIKTGKGVKIDEVEFDRISCDSQFFSIPSDVLFITYELVHLDDSTPCSPDSIDVVPVTQDEYSKIKNNPFRGSSRRRVVRIDSGSDIVELISKYKISDYLIKYIAKPTPIVVAPLEEVSIEGFNNPTECKLDPILHMDIVRRAVLLAYSSRTQRS